MSLYDDLGVSDDASKEEINKAYKRKAQKVHPDKKGGDVEKFKSLQRAHAVLTNDESRANYDQTGDEDTKPARDLAIDELATIMDHGLTKNIPDLVGFATKQVRGTIQDIEAHRIKSKATREMLSTYRKRVVKQDKHMILSAVFAERERKLDVMDAANEATMARGERMLAILQGYELEELASESVSASTPTGGYTFVIGGG